MQRKRLFTIIFGFVVLAVDLVDFIFYNLLPIYWISLFGHKVKFVGYLFMSFQSHLADFLVMADVTALLLILEAIYYVYGYSLGFSIFA